MQTTADIPAPWLLPLLAWLSPAFPVGAFSYSHGLEWAVEEGLVHDRLSLESWALSLLRHGALQADAIIFAHAWRAAAAADGVALAELREFADALAPTAELALETLAQGAAFKATLAAAWPGMERVDALLPGEAPLAYPVGVGAATALAGLPLQPSLAAFVHALLANLVSAGVRLVPLGQTDGQRVTAALHLACTQLPDSAMTTALDDLATATLMVDWCSMRHETQYTRLFRS